MLIFLKPRNNYHSHLTKNRTIIQYHSRPKIIQNLYSFLFQKSHFLEKKQSGLWQLETFLQKGPQYTKIPLLPKRDFGKTARQPRQHPPT